MSVSVSGAVLAALLYEQSNCNGDQEGFLLGKEVNHVTDTISDSQINNRKEETVTYIYNYLPANSPFSWYDHAGRVNSDKLKVVLKGHKPQDIIGWYRWRRQSTLCPSLREKAMHRALVHALPGVDARHFIFSLFTCSATNNLSTHSFDYIFQNQSGRSLVRLPVTVVNLKDTSQADYKLQASHNIDPLDGIYADTLKRSRPEFLDVSTGRLHQVQAIHALNGQLHAELKDMFSLVSSSEEVLGSLATEVEHLRERWKRKRYPPTPNMKDIKKPIKPKPQSSSQQPRKNDGPVTDAVKLQETHRLSKVTRQRSKQEEIMEEIKDLVISHPPQDAGTKIANASPGGDAANATMASVQLLAAVPLIQTLSSQDPVEMEDNQRAISPALSTHSANSMGKSQEDMNMVVETLTSSPPAARRGRSKLNNAEDQPTVKNTNKEKAQKKDAFDFVNNLMQDVKSTGIKRNVGPNTNIRKTRAQSMIVDRMHGKKEGSAKQRSVTPTREPGHKTNNPLEKNIKVKSSTLPINIGSPRLDESMDDDLPASPTY